MLCIVREEWGDMGVEKIQYNVQEGVDEIGVFKLQLSVVRVG